jgi:site-specific DNA-methyltransferase (adenine-specific)
MTPARGAVGFIFHFLWTLAAGQGFKRAGVFTCRAFNPNRKDKEMILNDILCGNSADLLAQVPEGSIDLVVTDPPYLVNYRDRTGRSLQNDDNPDGVLPVFAPMARAMRQDSYAICFVGWSALPQFTAAWEAAGLRIVSQIIWQKDYTSRKGYTAYRHESTFVLAKGNPAKPANLLPSVMDWVYSGNRAHPTEKAVEIIAPLIRCFSNPGDLVCDLFSGFGSTAVAAALSNRQYLGIDIDPAHVATAKARLAGVARYRTEQNTLTAA